MSSCNGVRADRLKRSLGYLTIHVSHGRVILSPQGYLNGQVSVDLQNTLWSGTRWPNLLGYADGPAITQLGTKSEDHILFKRFFMLCAMVGYASYHNRHISSDA